MERVGRASKRVSDDGEEDLTVAAQSLMGMVRFLVTSGEKRYDRAE
jgi:hypothetical protein